MGSDDERASSRGIWDEMAAGWESQKDYITSVTGHVSRWMIDALAPRSGETILEIAAGTGEVGLNAAEHLGDSGRVLITDFSGAMIDVARRRADERGIANVEFRTLDAERMDIADDSIDGVLCRWGFMLMLDPDAAVTEARRVLRPEGRLVFSVWGPPEHNPWVTLWGMVMMQRGHAPQSDPYGPGGMFSLSKSGRIEVMLEQAGFTDIRIEEMRVDWTYADADELWRFAREVAGAIAQLIKELPSEEVEAVRAAVLEQAEDFRDGNGYVLPGLAINVVAT